MSPLERQKCNTNIHLVLQVCEEKNIKSCLGAEGQRLKQILILSSQLAKISSSEQLELSYTAH